MVLMPPPPECADEEIPGGGALLPKSVVLVKLAVPSSLRIPPPPANCDETLEAELPEMVALVNVMVP